MVRPCEVVNLFICFLLDKDRKLESVLMAYLLSSHVGGTNEEMAALRTFLLLRKTGKPPCAYVRELVIPALES